MIDRTTRRYYIETYADTRGLWHAIVRDPAHDTSKRLTDNEVRNIREAGKRAILRELYEREESPTRTRADITTQVHIRWNDCRQWGRKVYIGSPDTLHIAETPAN